MRRLNERSLRGLYRSRDGVLLGVCRGIAQHFDLSVTWIRLFVVVMLLLTGVWPITGIYLVASLIMKPEPVRPFENEEEQDFYESYVDSRRRAAESLRKRYRDIERRIRRMEDAVTSKEYDWDRRMGSGSA